MGADDLLPVNIFLEMLRLGYWLIRWVCLVVLAAMTVAVLRASLGPLHSQAGWSRLFRSHALWAAFCGLVARWMLARWRRGDPLEFLDTLEHELTHALAGSLTFAPPVSLTATLRRGGAVELRRTNPVAALAPYFLPLYACAAALLTLVLHPALLPYGRPAVAFLLGSFAWRLARELHLGQTDFREYGLVFSLFAVAILLPLTLLAALDMAGILEVAWRGEVWTDFLAQFQWLRRHGPGSIHVF